VKIPVHPANLLVVLIVMLMPIHCLAAAASGEEVLKKTKSNASPFVSLSPTMSDIPKTEQPKLFDSDKAKPASAEAAPERSGELKDQESEETKEQSEIKEQTKAPSLPSPIEKLISADEIVEPAEVPDENPASTLTQFGYNYFQNLSLLPQIDVQVSPDYLVGYGDSIMLTVWGSIEGNYELKVNSGGEVILPRIGPVGVAGLPFGKLPGVLRVHLAKVFRDFDLAVNMGKLRTNKVSVIGEVNAPGDYTVSSLASVLNALAAAGGPTKNGSLRNIKIRRMGKAEESIDLYDFFMTGDKRKDVRIASGDTIFVPVIGRIAAVAGMVKRPAIYELRNETTLRELLGLAEGVTVTGYLQRIQISRVIANQKKQVIDLNLDPASSGKTFDELAGNIPVQDMDIVKVFPINRLLRNHFKLEGHLERPGFYALKPGIRISSVLNRQLLLPEYASTIEVTRLYPPNLEPRKILLDLEKALAGDSGQDIEIQEFDTIKLFSKWELQERMYVRASGEVQEPGEFPLLKDMTVRDLLLQAGNPSAAAYLKNAEVSRFRVVGDKAQQEPIMINLEEALKGNPAHNLTLEPFDELIVRRIPNWTEAKDRYVTLTGEFVFPGVYPVYKGERLSAVIARAGGFTDKAYPKGAKFTRESVRKIQQQRMDEALVRAEENVISKKTSSLSAAASKEEVEAAKSTLEGLERSIALLKTKKAEGRVIIKLATPEKLKGTPYDVELVGGDALYVPFDPKSVNILGNVYNPTTSLYEPRKDVAYYLDRVGGPTSDGDEDEMYLVKADGTVYSNSQASSFFFHNSFLTTNVDSGDTLVVPQKIERTALMRNIKDITTIISQIALSAGTVFLGLR